MLLRSPKPLGHLGGTKSLGFRLFEPSLLVPKPSAQHHRETQPVRIVHRVRGVVIKLVLPEKQFRQRVTIPKQFIVPAEGGRDPGRCLEMLDGLSRLALGAVYVAEDTMALADWKLIVFVGEEIDRLRRSFIRGVELPVVMQSPSEPLPRVCLSWDVAELSVDFQRFSRLPYSILVEADWTTTSSKPRLYRPITRRVLHR